jgi:conjugal transfer pilus assembly protein TraV
MASQGIFNENSFGTAKENAVARAENKIRIKNGYPLNAFDGTPIRSNESVQQIWIGPYEDTSGTYHEPSYIYTVVKKGQWIGKPVKAIQD